MIIVGLPYSFTGQMGHDEVVGGSPYGASTIAGPKDDRMPSERDLAGAKFQGEHVAKIAKLLSAQSSKVLTTTSSESNEKKKKKTEEKDKRHSEKRHEKKQDQEKEKKAPKSPRKGESKEKPKKKEPKT